METKPTLAVRHLEISDLAEVNQIEARAHQMPWSPAQCAACLETPYQSWVVVEAASVVGYALGQLVVPEYQLLNIAVADFAQGRGVGAYLLQAVCDELRAEGVTRLTLEVRESNLRAQRLYAKMGATEVGRRAHYYKTATGREDALYFDLSLS